MADRLAEQSARVVPEDALVRAEDRLRAAVREAIARWLARLREVVLGDGALSASAPAPGSAPGDRAERLRRLDSREAALWPRTLAGDAPAVHAVEGLMRVRALLLGVAATATPGSAASPSALNAAAPPPPPDPGQASAADPAWILALHELVLPEVEALFSERFLAFSRTAVISAQPYVEAFVEETFNRLRLFPASAWEEIRPELAESISEGETFEELRDRIEHVLDFDTAADATTPDHDLTKRLRGKIRALEKKIADPATTPAKVKELRAERRQAYEDLHAAEYRWQWKAERIARTEAAAALNGGAFEGALFRSEAFGVPQAKAWISELDTRVRDTHKAAHGQLVPLAAPFIVGEAALMYPGDPTGPAREIIQCRCSFGISDIEDLTDDEREQLAVPPAESALSAGGTMPVPQDPPGLTAASGGPYTGAMLALIPSEADLDRLVVEDGEHREDLHLTLVFLGGGEAVDEATTAALLDALTEIARGTPPIEANGFAVSAFSPGTDDACLVLGVGGPGLDDVRAQVLTAAQARTQVPEQHTPWVPHVTLTYTGDLGMVAELVSRTGEITFDRLRLAVGGTAHDLDLTGELMADDQNTDTQALPNGFRGALAPLGIRTGDGRMLMPPPDGALRLRQPPLTLLWQPELGNGHDGAVIAARIDRAWMETGPDGIPYIMGEGAYDLGGEHGAEAARLHGEGFFNGVSLDLDDVTVEDRWYSTATGLPVDVDAMGEDAMYRAWEEGEIDLVAVLTDFRVMGGTLTPQPAFDEARLVALYDYVAAVDALVAGAALDGIRTYDAGDFAAPDLPGPTPITITEDGQIRGHLALWGTCHTGIGDRCIVAPRSATAYALFHAGAVMTDAGPLGVGKITLGTGHADLTYGVRAAAAHYDDTGTAVAVVRAGEDAHGIYVAGRLLDDVTPAQVETLLRSPLSGDWRTVDGNLELVGALAVNVPGFPVPRALAASGALGEQISLVAAGAAQLARARRRTRPGDRRGPEQIDYGRLAAAIVAETNADRRRRERRDELAAAIQPPVPDPAARLAALNERMRAA